MAVKHILKDGTVLEDISGVVVPQEITKRVAAIAMDVRKEKKRERNN